MWTTTQLCLRNLSHTVHGVVPQKFIHSTARQNILLTQILCAEPMRKKKKIDPSIIKMQTDRKKKKLEKQIRRAQRFAQKLKPVDELELHRHVAKDAPPRNALDLDAATTALLSEVSQREQTLKEWSIYSANANTSLHAKFTDMLASQERALAELKLASPQLYDRAVQKSEDMLSVTYSGPVETPPIPGYIQDGIYRETTNSYDMNPEITKLMLNKNNERKK